MAELKTVYRNSDGVRRTLITDSDQPDLFHVNTEVDVEALISNNRTLEEFEKPFDTNKLLARVPMTVYEKSILEDWDEGDWTKWLNDPDNAAFRVWRGRV